MRTKLKGKEGKWGLGQRRLIRHHGVVRLYSEAVEVTYVVRALVGIFPTRARGRLESGVVGKDSLTGTDQQ